MTTDARAWLADHDRAVKAEALREVSAHLAQPGVLAWGDLMHPDGTIGRGVSVFYDRRGRSMELTRWLDARADQIEGDTP